MENKKILSKIKKLFEMTKENGATDGEIQNALVMAQRLMLKHNIKKEDLKINSSDIQITEIEIRISSDESEFCYDNILAVISKSYSCQVLRTKKGEIWAYKIVGFKTDSLIVVSVFSQLLPVLRKLITKRYKDYAMRIKTANDNKYTLKELRLFGVIYSKRIFTNSYLLGFSNGLYNKLNEDKESVLNDENQKENFNKLVLKKDSLIDEFIKETLNPITEAERQEKIFSEAYLSGKNDGIEHGLPKGVEKGK